MESDDKLHGTTAPPTLSGPGWRKQAEARLLETSSSLRQHIDPLSPEPAQQTLHELHIHQVELELQNEELRKAQVALENSRARYFDLYDLAPVGYCTLNEPGLILQANLTAAALLGATRSTLLNQRLQRFIFKDDQDMYHLLRTRLLQKGDAQSCELRMVSARGAPVWVHLAATTARDANGETELRIVLSDVSKRKLAESALFKSEAFSHAILDSLSAEIAVLDHDGKIVAVNQSWQRFALENSLPPGKLAPQVKVGANYLAVCLASAPFTSDEAQNAHDGIRAVLDGRRSSFSMEYPCHSPTQQRWFSMNVTPLGDGVVVAHTNVSQIKETEYALREQKEFFHLIAENIDDFIAVLDLEGRRLYNSPSYLQFFGAAADLQGTDSFIEIHPDDRERVKLIFMETIRTGVGRRINYRFVMKDGSIRDMESRGNVIRDNTGRVARVVVVSRDVTERKTMEEQVRQLAFHDALTNLPNRRLLNDRLSQVMANRTHSSWYGALMFLDLDNFKLLNDTHGHVAGDSLLVEAASRLTRCVREMDTVARFGGDEFVVMLSELDEDKGESRAQAAIVAEKIRNALSEPYILRIKRAGGIETTVDYRCTVSIGVVLFVRHDASQEDIFKWADRAMYQAKEEGRNLTRFYEPDAQRFLAE